jgi:hypothetical protein
MKSPHNGIISDKNLNVFIYGRDKTRCPLLPFLFIIVLEVLVTAIRQEKRYGRHPNWKGRSKMISADDMILYEEKLQRKKY